MATFSIYIKGINQVDEKLEVWGLVHYSPNSQSVQWYTEVAANFTKTMIELAAETAANEALATQGIFFNSPSDTHLLFGMPDLISVVGISYAVSLGYASP